MCCVGELFIHRPTNLLAACTHMHTQNNITDLRNVLQQREDWVRGQAHQQPAEEVEEEGEEVEQVRLRACVLYPQFQALRQRPGTIRLFMPENEVCCRICYVSRCIMSQPAVFMLECVQSSHYSSL